MSDCEHIFETRGNLTTCSKCGLIQNFEKAHEYVEVQEEKVENIEIIEEEIIEPEMKSSGRKTITIQEEEFDKWSDMKGYHSWTSLLQTVREGYELFKEAIRNLTVNINTGAAQTSTPIERIKRPVSSLKVQKDDPKSKMLAELKELSDGHMTIEQFRSSILKPMTEQELLKIQKSDEELVKAQNQLLRLHPPK